jgi:methionine-rich copper-binding protein CopC
MSRLSAGLAAVVVTALSVSVAAHFSLVKSTPAAGQALEASPTRVQLWFSEAPAPGVSQLKLLTADKTELPLEKTIIDKDKSMHADVPKPIAPGAYVLSWRAAGADGHVLSGEIKFTVAPKSSN